MLKFFVKLYENQVWNELFWVRNIRCFFAAVTIICIGTAWWSYRYVSVDVYIDTVPILSVSSQPYYLQWSQVFECEIHTSRCRVCWRWWWLNRGRSWARLPGWPCSRGAPSLAPATQHLTSLHRGAKPYSDTRSDIKSNLKCFPSANDPQKAAQILL